MSSPFQVGGSLTSDSTLYVQRHADTEITDALTNNELCYIFNTRQIGKSSLLLKTKNHMQSLGYRCSYVDVSRIGSINISSEQWYAGLAFELWRNFSLPAGMAFFEWWQSLGDIPPPQKLTLFWEHKLAEAFPEDSFILFFDEVDSVISLSFPADDFFTAIRSAYNTEKSTTSRTRLNFALFGVALPSDLIKDTTRAPFNIGQAIALDCFSFNEALALVKPFSYSAELKEKLLKRTLHWTGGQPFLTQKLLSILSNEVAGQSQAIDESTISESTIDKIVNEHFIDNWRNNDNPEHLKTIYDRITLDENNIQLLTDYLKVCQNNIPPEALNNYQRLYLTGLVRIKDKNVVVKSHIYQTIFSIEWAEQELAKLRPYHEKLNNWLQNPTEQYLLNEKELIEAKKWADSRSVSEQDHQYLAACQEKINNEVKQKNIQLNKEIVQRRLTEEKLQKTLIALDDAKLQAENANKAKSHFLAKVSHEIRTHVNSIIGINYLARKQPNNTEHLKSIDRAAQYMQTVINDLVDINQIERGEISFRRETFYIDSIIDNLIHINAPLIKNKGLDFLVNIPKTLTPALVSDPHRLEQVLSNLLANAIKYCTLGAISIEVKEIELPALNNQVAYQFLISDTGSGVAKTNVDAVVSGDQTSPVNMGIGLTICYELLKLMDSELHVESAYQQGSTFSFVLPFDIINIDNQVVNEALPIVGIPSTLKSEVYQPLNTIGCVIRIFDINAKHFADEDIDVFLVDEHHQKYQQQLMALVNTSDVELVPLLTVGSPFPHWLSTLRFTHRIDLPITPRKLLNELVSFTHGPSTNTNDNPKISQANQYHILVAEDDEINQDVIQSLLSMIGVNSTIVNNGLEATEALKNSHFDLVLMDIEMPIMNGLEAVTLIRDNSFRSEHTDLNKIPIIAMTAHALLGDKQKFITSGMNDHLSKPIEPSQLSNVLRQWLPKIEVKESQRKAIEFPEIIDVNIAEGLNRCNQNGALYLKVLTQFSQKYKYPLALDELTVEQSRLYFHAIKGTAGNIGANKLSKKSANLEQFCVDNMTIPAVELTKFSHELQTLCQNIESTLKQESSNVVMISGPSAEIELNADLAKKLQKTLNEDHAKAIAICEQLSKSQNPKIIEICEAINNFDIDQAHSLLTAWLTQLNK